MEEQVIQETPVASSEQPVAETTGTVNIVDNTAAYEQQIQALTQRATEAEEKFQGIKGKLDDVYKKQDEQRRKTLEDQGQWKDLWEEANKTAQSKDQQIAELEQKLADLHLRWFKTQVISSHVVSLLQARLQIHRHHRQH